MEVEDAVVEAVEVVELLVEAPEDELELEVDAAGVLLELSDLLPSLAVAFFSGLDEL
ncbi:MAG TPA: hypothetical protein VIM73_21960 [Polyangiaceae bacterium]